MDVPVADDVFLFEAFRLDRRNGGLFRVSESGALTPVPVGSRALDVLAFLAAHHGQLVSKQAIMQAVWPDVVVEEKNLTVQISALRRVLDDGRTGPSCIQTESGRGYRFVAAVTTPDDETAASLPLMTPVAAAPTREALVPHSVRADGASPLMLVARRRPRALELAGFGALLLAIGFGAAWWLRLDRTEPINEAPRLSLVVLPFDNLSGDPKDNYLADGITDDLTTDLSHIPEAFVIARESAYTYRGKGPDVRQIGRELGVRYVLEGSVRRINSTLRVNVQLISSATGAHVWSDRFDEEISELAAGQEQVVTRMRAGLGISVVEIENARGLRERPTNPDAFDLILRARSLQNLPPSAQRNAEAQALYERALSLDPTSAPAMSSIAFLLMEKAYPGWRTAEDMQRAEKLLMQARAIAPHSETVLNYTVQWLRKMGRYEEGVAVAEQLVRNYPNNPAGYFDLAQSKTIAGHAEEAIPLQEKAILLNPRSPWLFKRYRDMGFASLLLGRDRDAISFLERSLAINPDFYNHQWTYRFLAAAYAQTGQPSEARRALAEADRLFPYDTVRSHWPDDRSSPVFATQVRHLQEGLRLAGERDHADEEADFGVPAEDALHDGFAGLTPTTASGARTIRTADLIGLLAGSRPVVIDTVSYSWGRSMPGAVGLENSGVGGSLTDAAQDRLRSKMRELTAGDLNRPIVAVGFNAERFDGRNLALRLAALGYAKVYWYRGGREAWEVNGLPETELTIQDW